MENILKRAQERKLENEKLTLARAQKERENEDPILLGKEQFITRAYKQKLEELARHEHDKKASSQLKDSDTLSMPEFCKALLDKNYRRR